MKIIIINGPNLNLTGSREKSIYGELDFLTYLEFLRKKYPFIEIEYFQSNHTGVLIDKLQQTDFIYNAIILNAGALTHTSLALGDAVASIRTTIIEVHITNLLKREFVRHNSYTGVHCKGVIMGFGLESYRLAIESLLNSDI